MVKYKIMTLRSDSVEKLRQTVSAAGIERVALRVVVENSDGKHFSLPPGSFVLLEIHSSEQFEGLMCFFG